MKAKDLMRAGLFLLAMGVAAAFAHAQELKAVLPHGPCAEVYHEASHALDSVYGLLPGVDPAQTLAASMALDDAASLARSTDPRISGPLCGLERVEELERLTVQLRTERDRLDADRQPYRIRHIEDRAADAVAELAGWVGTRK